MKSRNKLIGLIITAGLFSAQFTGCKKYEEGPAISLRSKKERVVNDWTLDKYFRNGNDKTSQLLLSDFQLNLKESGELTQAFIDEGGDKKSSSGSWEFDDEKEILDVDGISSVEYTEGSGTVSNSKYHILKLKENEMWFEFENGGDHHEFHLTPN